MLDALIKNINKVLNNKNNMKYKLKRLSVFFLLIPLIAEAGTVNKSPADSREYETFTLKNGIEVITVSDPSLATSAATLSVEVGHRRSKEHTALTTTSSDTQKYNIGPFTDQYLWSFFAVLNFF